MNPAKEKPISNWLKEKPIIGYFSTSRTHQIFLFGSISVLFVIAVYIWFISFGLWTKWPGSSDYYNQLATAFEHGSLALEKKVDPALLSLANPYDPKARAGLNYPLDFSLYRGKYYLYFGPVPALLLVIFKFLGFGKIGDQYLVFTFISGTFVFQSLLVTKIWERFFHDIPSWLLIPCIIFGGLVSPLTWMLTEGRIYEAAGASGQFFFLAGFYFAITGLTEQTISSKKLLISGTSWALALGSRITQALPIGFVILMITFLAIRTYFQTRSLPKTISPILALGLPLALGISTLGWYNWARFNSIFETGFSYELTTPNLQKYSQVLFSPLYTLPNLYNYLAAPPQIHNIFPFLQPIRGRGDQIFSFLILPKVYYTRSATGIFFSTPFILFAAISIISVLFLKRGAKGRTTPDDDTFLFRWTVISLLGSFLLGFGIIVSYFWVVTRFLLDCTPSLILLSIIGFWSGYCFLIPWPISRKVYVVVGMGLMIISVVSSNLLVLYARASSYQAFNPDLWNQLSGLFSR